MSRKESVFIIKIDNWDFYVNFYKRKVSFPKKIPLTHTHTILNRKRISCSIDKFSTQTHVHIHTHKPKELNESLLHLIFLYKKFFVNGFLKLSFLFILFSPCLSFFYHLLLDMIPCLSNHS